MVRLTFCPKLSSDPPKLAAALFSDCRDPLCEALDLLDRSAVDPMSFWVTALTVKAVLTSNSPL